MTKTDKPSRSWLLTAILLPLLALACGLGLGVNAADLAAASTDMISTFEIEQVYVNVPEMDVFVYALDSNGNSISPTVARAAGVTVQIGDTTVPTGTISQAAEPICYIFAIDNSAGVPKETVNAYRKAIRRVVKNKGASDQVVLYTLGDGVKCACEATDDAGRILTALNKITPSEGTPAPADVTGAATTIYSDVMTNFQSLAPRKVLMVCTDSSQIISNVTLISGMLSGATSELNMALYTFVAVDGTSRFSFLDKASNGRVIMCDIDDIPTQFEEKQEYLAKALEIKTSITSSFYGTKLDVLTLGVPALGSAVKATATVYMGNRLQAPAVTSVQVQDRTHMLVTFNQAVENADAIRSYRLVCEDVWGWRPSIKAVDFSDDGRSAVLTTEPLYNGKFDISLYKVTSKITSANISDVKTTYSFVIDDWPRDNAFYLDRFRLPLLAALIILGALALSAALQKRRDKAAEQLAEAEHLLQNGARTDTNTLPSRWLTLFVRPARAVAETRWTAMVKSSLMIGSDPAQCDLCIKDGRVGAQHCIISIEGENVVIRALGDCTVKVNDARIGDAHRLQNDDTIKIGRSTLRFVI